jgi:hypothetical protein
MSSNAAELLRSTPGSGGPMSKTGSSNRSRRSVCRRRSKTSRSASSIQSVRVRPDCTADALISRIRCSSSRKVVLTIFGSCISIVLFHDVQETRRFIEIDSGHQLGRKGWQFKRRRLALPAHSEKKLPQRVFHDRGKSSPGPGSDSLACCIRSSLIAKLFACIKAYHMSIYMSNPRLPLILRLTL